MLAVFIGGTAYFVVYLSVTAMLEAYDSCLKGSVRDCSVFSFLGATPK